MSTMPAFLAARPPSLARALHIQARVIGALLMRELHTRYGRDNIGYLWMMLEPMLLATVIGSLHSTMGHRDYSGDMRPLPFALTGYITFILFRNIVNRTEGAIEVNAPLLYHKQVTVLDITIARALLEFFGCFVTFVIMMTLACCVGLANPPVRPLALLASWGIMFWYSLGNSLVITGVSHDQRTVSRLIPIYSYLMIGVSGAWFALAWVPHPYREWLTYIPLTGIFELARYGEFSVSKLDYFYPLYDIGGCVVLTWVGLISIRIMRHRIHL